MEHLLIYFTRKCGSFSLPLELPSSSIICCEVLLFCWFGLFFGPNGGFIEYLQNHSYGLVEVLDIDKYLTHGL